MTCKDDDNKNHEPGHLATEVSSLLSDTHGKQRRHERDIQKIDLQRARRYGMEEPGRYGRIQYTYGGVVFIYDPQQCREVTSFPSRDKASPLSGTKVTKPIILAKRTQTRQNMETHLEIRRQLWRNKAKWTSHSVLVVDCSGSMRRDDVNGARCRSDGVWMALARDFVKRQLETGSATTNDLVSVICMQEQSKTVMICEPMDWILYNEMIGKREWSELRPSGAGNYMPALDMAEKLLDVNQLGSCSLSLMFFSDGKPSDSGGDFAGRIGSLASKFGRRLTVCCIGMADKNEDFSTLEKMAAEAKEFGAISSFNKPSLSTDSLSDIITSLVTSLTTTKTEMTDVSSGKQKSIRSDLRREKKSSPDDLALTPEWDTYRNSSHDKYVLRVWTWSSRKDDFVYLMDPRCVGCYEVVGDTSFQAIPGKGVMCPQCKACFFCEKCLDVGLRRHVRSSECQTWMYERRHKDLTMKPIPSFSVAVKKYVFDEGAERAVRKFRFLDESGTFIGPKMVAKESRFVEMVEKGSTKTRMDYHRQFMRTQSLAQRFAEQFNEALDNAVAHFDSQSQEVLRRLPRIQFLDPLVIEFYDEQKAKGVDLLVEPLLEGEYRKYNNNMGYIQKNNNNDVSTYRNRGVAHSFQQRNAFQCGDLGAIIEEEEEDDDEDDSDDGIIDGDHTCEPEHGSYRDLSEHHFPQAFSHFTYERSRKQFLVVDLQGVLQVKADGTRCYMLTDPAIHRKKKSRRALLSLSHIDLGRTDRGEKGIHAFFESHTCTDVCRLLGLEERNEEI